MNIKKIMPYLFLISIIFIVGCTSASQTTTDSTSKTVEIASDWKEVELKDVKTGDIFKISDFEGKPILLESFAVWCPTCTAQQRETKKLHDEVGDSIITISLDTDPNEDEERILQHITRNNFKGFYAVAPPDMTRALIDEFGIGIVNAPSVPMILICEDQSTRFLRGGIKTPEDLKAEIAQGC